MRIDLIVFCIILSCGVATCSASEPPLTNRKAEPVNPAVQAILRDASEIVLKQEEHQHYWTERVLLYLGDVQIRAGDFDGALRSIRASSYDYGRNAALVHLAEEAAHRGNRKRAFDILQLLGSDHGWQRDSVEDGVQLRWIEHLIVSGEIGRTRKAIEQLKSKRHRPDALRELAVAYSKSGDTAQAAEQFSLTLDAAANLKNEFDRARAFWETADAQLSVGKADAARKTSRWLLETVELKDPWVKVSALRESAVLVAKAKDERIAHRLFRRAIEAQKAIDGANKINALKLISLAQAGVGYIDDALKTASLIKHSERDFAQDCPREEALYAIAVAQVKANDVDGAVRTALAVEYFVQFRDDAIHKIVDHQIAKRDLKTALMMADKIDNPSRKATAILKVATAHAKLGDPKTAARVAGRIELTQRDQDLIPGVAGKARFDYRLPRRWGVCYDAGLVFTIASHQMSIQRAAEVAAATMALSQALGRRPDQSYAIMFNEILTEEVTLALARAHAASGDPSDALAWAKQIGSSDKVNSSEDHDARLAVEQRIHALIGVAEGILDRSRKALPEPAP